MSCQGPVLQCIWVSGATLTTANELPSHVCPHRDAWDDATPHCASAASCSRRERSQAPHSRLLTWERTILHVVDQCSHMLKPTKPASSLVIACPNRHQQSALNGSGQHDLLSCTRCTCPPGSTAIRPGHCSQQGIALLCSVPVWPQHSMLLADVCLVPSGLARPAGCSTYDALSTMYSTALWRCLCLWRVAAG